MPEWHLYPNKVSSTNIVEACHRWHSEEHGDKVYLVRMLICIRDTLELESDKYYRKVQQKLRPLNKRRKEHIIKYQLIASAVKILETFTENTQMHLLNQQFDEIQAAIESTSKSKYYKSRK